MPDEPKKEEKALTLFSKIEEDTEFDPDPSSCGLTPEMLKEAQSLYTSAFVSKNPLDKMAAGLFYNDVNFEKLTDGTTEGVSAE